MSKNLARPHVTVNMAMSLDGKISTYRRENIVLGTEHDRRLMDTLRSKADVVIVGAGTVRHDGLPILMRYRDLLEKRISKGLPPHPTNVVLSRSLDVPASSSFFKYADTEKMVFTTRAAPASRVKRLNKTAEVIVLPRKTLPPGEVLEVLHQRKVKRVLLEGGGELHFSFVKANVVDELYITLTPRLLGGVNAPSVLDGRGFSADNHPKLSLVSSKRIDDELYLRYRLTRR